MQVNSTTSASTANAGSTGTTASTSKDLVSYDAFLQLLIAQLKNQDPTKPMDSSQYVSQLSSLSSLEQSVKQTASLERMLAMSSLAEATSAIGLRATSADGQTTGIVQSTRLDATGVIATLDTGADLTLASGVKFERT